MSSRIAFVIFSNVSAFNIHIRLGGRCGHQLPLPNGPPDDAKRNHFGQQSLKKQQKLAKTELNAKQHRKGFSWLMFVTAPRSIPNGIDEASRFIGRRVFRGLISSRRAEGHSPHAFTSQSCSAPQRRHVLRSQRAAQSLKTRPPDLRALAGEGFWRPLLKWDGLFIRIQSQSHVHGDG